MIPGWLTTGTYITITLLLVFLSTFMSREACDDFRRHRLDNDENPRIANILIKDTALNKMIECQQDQQQNETEFNGNK